MPWRMRRAGTAAAAITGIAGVVACAASPSPARPPSAGPAPVTSPGARADTAIQVNQAGYGGADPKVAVLMSTHPVGRSTVRVVNGSGRTVLRVAVGAQRRAWNARFRFVYPLVFSALRTPGTYTLVSSGGAAARSAPIVVGPPGRVYDPLVSDVLRFFAVQTDGAGVDPSVLARRPAHLHDAAAQVYAAPRFTGVRPVLPLRALGRTTDASGGWFDAGDYLKFTETTSFADTLLLYAASRPGPQATDIAATARTGTDWLLRMWHPDTGTLDMQVGIGDGLGDRLIGDHDLWRLPQTDDGLPAGTRSPTRYLAQRPVFPAGPAGAPISPNLAGRTAAALGLCAQVYAASDPAYADTCLTAARAVYARADTHPTGPLATAAPHAYYPETTWMDDMALGATEIARALLQRPGPPAPVQADAATYLDAAAHWAVRLLGSSQADQDSLGLYDVTAMMDEELARTMTDARARGMRLPPGTVTPGSLAQDLADQLRIARALARREPFGLGNPAAPADPVSHALGFSVMQGWLHELTGTRSGAGFATGQRDWVLGRNPWGTSFMVGVGTRFPVCPQHQVANLVGSRSSAPPLLVGAVVPGPGGRADVAAARGIPDGARRCHAPAAPWYVRADRPGQVYMDATDSPTTSEPSIDLAALAVVAFTQAAGH